jgi:glucokinase
MDKIGVQGGAFIGLDIGGQSIKGFRLEPDGAVSCRATRPTPASAGAGEVLGTVAWVLGELGKDVAAVGVGTPGAVDAAGRIAGEAVNIPGWMGTELRVAVEEFSGAPTFVRNDGNLAAYAEWAARGGEARALLFIGLGTGIGGGYVEDGRILSGIDDRALEIGHVVVHHGGRACVCGRSGCVEAYASGPSMARIACELASEPGVAWEESSLARELREPGASTDARALYLAYARGDRLAHKVHSCAVEALARVVAAALAFLAPDRVVFGGGVLRGAGFLVEDVAALVPNYVYEAEYRDCRFEKALLGPEAGLLGAALYGARAVISREELLRLSVSATTGLKFEGC